MTERRKRLRSGESLVEALVGIFIFLMILAILQGAVSFCTNAQRKSEEIRERNAVICQNLRETAYTEGGAGAEANLVFKAVVIDPDTGKPIRDPSTGEPITSGTLFNVKADLGTKDVKYEEEGEQKSILFYLFGSPRPPADSANSSEPKEPSEPSGGEETKPETGEEGQNPGTGEEGPEPDTGEEGQNPGTGEEGPEPDTGAEGPNPETGGENP